MSNEQLGIPTKTSDLENDSDFVSDNAYVHTDNNYDDESKALVDTLGTAAFYDAPESGDASEEEVVLGSDSRLTDARTPVSHTHTKSEITDFPSLGTASAYNVPVSGNAGQTEVVKGDDTRLSDARTPVSHTHTLSEITDSGTAAAKNFTTSVSAESTDLVTSNAVKTAIDNAVASSYHHAGTKTVAELTSALLIAENQGNVYNITDSGTTTADFIEGAGHPIDVGANVGIAKVGNAYKFDLLSGFVDTSNFVEKSSTNGLLKNDGSVDTKQYVEQVQGKGLSTNDYDNTAKGIVDGVTSALADKVDKVQGKGLSTNDYDNTAKGIVDGVTSALADKVDKVNGKGLSTNDYDNTAKGIVDGVTSALNGKVDKVEGKGLSENDFTDTLKDKLDGISAGATKTESSATNGHISIDDVDTTVYDDTAIQNKLSDGTTEVEGNPLSFTTLSAQTAESCEIELNPIQDLHGYDKPWVGGAGKNLFNKDDMALSSDTTCVVVNEEMTITATNHANATANNGSRSDLRFSAGTYYIKANFKSISNLNTSTKIAFRDSSGNVKKQINVSEIGQISGNLTIDEDFYFAIMITGATAASNVVVIENVMLSTADVPFEPYTNICPISGRSSVEVEVASSSSAEPTQELEIALGQTVYGGTLDVTNGVLTVDRAGVDLGSLNWDMAATNTTNIYRCRSTGIQNDAKPSATQETKANIICSAYGTEDNLTNRAGVVSVSLNTSSILCIYDENYNTSSSANDFKTFITGQTLVYELTTPTTIQLTSNAINLLKGANYITTDGDNITLTYRNGEVATLGDLTSAMAETDTKIAESQILVDTVTAKKYRLVVTSGVLDIEEITE